MKLTIGDNIRKLRREKDLTQEQLAERLGVSFQAVSRWENCTTYPDIELLPAIARFFETSVDKLIGVPEEEKERQAEKLINEFCDESLKKLPDAEKLVDILRQIRRDYIDADTTYLSGLWICVTKAALNFPEVLQELRLLSEERLERFPTGDENRRLNYYIIKTMFAVEDDEHLEDFLNKYSSFMDLSYDTLCYHRYQSRNNAENLEAVRQHILFKRFRELMDRQRWQNMNSVPNIKVYARTNQCQLHMLHAFCDMTPNLEHPVSGNGEVDIFVYERLDLGIRRACYLSELGDIEGAFAVLEDEVSLLEKVMKITDEVVYKSNSPFIDNITIIFSERWDDFDQDGIENRHVSLDYVSGINNITSHNMWAISPEWYHYCLTTPHGWEWFDPIRNDPRYQGYTDRIKALIQERPAQQEPEEAVKKE